MTHKTGHIDHLLKHNLRLGKEIKELNKNLHQYKLYVKSLGKQISELKRRNKE